MVDAAGSPVRHVLTTAWGELLPGFTQDQTPADRHAFTQREQDTETVDANGNGLLYFRARNYDPRSGRFSQTDPLLSNRASQHYSYAQGNPVQYTDPTGLDINLISNEEGGERGIAAQLVYNYLRKDAPNLSRYITSNGIKLALKEGIPDDAQFTEFEDALQFAIVDPTRTFITRKCDFDPGSTYYPTFKKNIVARYKEATQNPHAYISEVLASAVASADVLGKQLFGGDFEIRTPDEAETFYAVVDKYGSSGMMNDLHDAYLFMLGDQLVTGQSWSMFGRAWKASWHEHKVDIAAGLVGAAGSFCSGKPHLNSFKSTGPRTIYAVIEHGGRLMRYGETADFATRSAFWRRFFKKLKIKVDVVPIKIVQGKQAVEQVQGRYIRTFERIFGTKPPFNYNYR